MRASAPWPAHPEQPHDFADAARDALRDAQLRANLRKATTTIRAKRAAVVAEVDDWQSLRAHAAAVKDEVLANLPTYLEQLEASVTAAGGIVHWARDAAECNDIVTRIAAGHGVTEVVKVKSLTTDEIGLNDALASGGVTAVETDLAELICQLAGDASSHILVPAIHKNRAEIRDLFRARLPTAPADLDDEPRHLAEAARLHLREKFLHARMAVSGANFACADTGTVTVVESEGNGRMCLTLPEVLVTVMGIEKVLPRLADLATFLELLPRSSTGERMNPYTSFWTGVHDGDGPSEFHLVLLDNGRSDVLAEPDLRQTLRCIRCSACLNVCPVYERVGGHAYGSTYPGPIGAVLTPQLVRSADAGKLAYASSLCGACYDVCPVMIEIPDLLVRLRAEHVEEHASAAESAAMRAVGWVLGSPRRFAAAQRLAGRLPLPRRLPRPLNGWSDTRDVPDVPRESFRDWWRKTHEDGAS